jgi:hypothetical protein
LSFTPLQSPPFLGCLYREVEAPSLGLRFPLRDISRWCSIRWASGPSPFRPRRFSRPRRLAPPPASWVCFTPQPRQGFSLQGFSLSHSRFTSSVKRALSSLAQGRCHRLPGGATSLRLALRALLHVRVRCRSMLFKHRPARSPLGIFLLQVLRLRIVERPSPLLRSWSSLKERRVVLPADLQRIADAEPGLPLARLPTC